MRNESTNSFDVLKKQHQIAANEALFSLVKGETFSYVLDYLVQSGADLNAMTEDGECPIFHLLLKDGSFHYDLFCAFISAGVDVNIKDCNGNTMLHKIVNEGDLEFASKIFDSLPDLDAQNDNGETPLHLAVKNNCEPMIIWLLDAGVSWNIKDNSGKTPIAYADDELRRKMIDYKIDPTDPYVWEE